ncbi:alpha/beta fold hydrolase [Cellulomonas shaoxiangyii]|uniref:Alpha/beta hydrolase n=1 Tax=Cellulomonas shaoxiangyii TaxID=2566013 RepID=A0A4P7SH03_9CELL|nr:alpha/beta hydrolase [Cellulomonas shaoxiangyii]QCB92938.1 alpha/beta hydrolase [Cellulomonas shaoxiangyii]TGY85374.1 alpha/beta hydrolase [Cellulomonas shaoxiangyii]
MSERQTPVVLVHGLRASRTMWRAQVEALEASGRTALAIDLPGHGRRLGERFTMAGAVEAVRDGVATVGGRAAVVGLSLGGYTAIAHAARFPQQVAGLVAAGCCTRPHRVVLRAWGAAAAGFARLPDRGAAVNQLLVDRTMPPEAAADVGAGGFALDVVEDTLREMSAADPLADLARVTAPVWLVNGRWDHFRGEEARFLAACRDGRLVVVPQATHLVSLVQPVRFTRVLLEALDAVDAAEDARAVSQDPGGGPADT